MKKYLLQKMIFGAALLLAAGGCTQDELAGDGTQLPEGKYPLEIASVTLNAEVNDEPWGASQAPQTRVAENSNGNGSVWEWDDTEKIGVQIGSGDPGTYTLGNQPQINGNPPAYWLSTQPNQAITAWYPAYEGDNGEVSLVDQSNRLAYVLKGSGTGKYDEAVKLTFAHALAKVRVVLKGDQTGKVNNIQIKSHTLCTHTKGENIQGSNEGWITMKKCNYNGTECWEANVVPNKPITELLLNGTTTVELAKEFIPKVAKVNNIDLGVGQYTVKLAEVTGNIYTVDPGGNVIIDGEGIESTKRISIPGGKGTTVTLKNLKLTLELVYTTPIISVDGDATIILSGKNELLLQENGNDSYFHNAINVRNNATLTIRSEDDGSLYMKGGKSEFSGGLTLTEGANLVIEGGKITSIVESESAYAGIGTANRDKCGTITIKGGEIYAKGGTSSPGIGAGGASSSCGGITITGGTVKVEGGPTSIYDIGHDADENSTCGPVSIGYGAMITKLDGTTSARIYKQ